MQTRRQLLTSVGALIAAPALAALPTTTRRLPKFYVAVWKEIEREDTWLNDIGYRMTYVNEEGKFRLLKGTRLWLGDRGVTYQVLPAFGDGSEFGDKSVFIGLEIPEDVANQACYAMAQYFVRGRKSKQYEVEITETSASLAKTLALQNRPVFPYEALGA